jgi:hypothetical protein
MNQLKNPFMRIGGRMILPPPILTYVQTSGSIHKIHPKARVAAIINAPSDIYRFTIPINAHTPTEADWASVLFGLTMALEKNCDAVAIENNNIGVIRALAMPRPRLRHEYARHYHNQIITLAKETEWTGIQNKVDILFR